MSLKDEASSVVKSPSGRSHTKTVFLPPNDSEKEEKIFLDLSAVPAEFKANGLDVVRMRILHAVEDLNHANGESKHKARSVFYPLFVYQFFEEPYDKNDLSEVAAGGRKDETVPAEPNDMEAECDSEEEEEAFHRGASVAQNGSSSGKVDDPEDPDEGLIVGYKDLSIDISFTCASLRPFAEIQYSSALPLAERSVPDLVKAIENVYGHKIITSADAMQKAILIDRNFVPFGRMLRTFSSKSHGVRNIELWEVGGKSDEFGYTTKFSEYLSSIQPFLSWFIYGASVLTTDDPKWLHYFLYENAGEQGYRFISYCSVYRYSLLPKRERGSSTKWTGEFMIRSRIAQFLTLPPYQKQGYGGKMMTGIIERLQEDPKTFDISVEDPDEQFTRLFNSVVSRIVKSYFSRKNLILDFNGPLESTLLARLHQDLKLPKKVLLLAYDIIACNTVRLAGQEATKKFYDRLALRQKLKLKVLQAGLNKKVQRIQHALYLFSDEDDQSMKMMRAQWVYNINEQVEKYLQSMRPDKIKEEIHQHTQIIQHAAKRMDEMED